MENFLNGIAYYENSLQKKQTIVFIHGFPFDHSMWEPQLKFFAEHYRVLSYDLRGHGRSEVGEGQYTIEFLVDDLIGLLDHLQIAQAALCGLSMGGYVALRAMERHPNRFNALILCDTKSQADSDEVKIKRSAAIQNVKKNGVKAFADEFIKGVLTGESLKTRPEISNTLIQSINRNSAVGISAALLAMAARTDTTASLSKIRVPVLILVGQEDKLTPPAASESMAKLIPHAEFSIVPKAAHVSNLENSLFFNEMLLKFLAAH